jgi:hypothetical protein
MDSLGHKESGDLMTFESRAKSSETRAIDLGDHGLVTRGPRPVTRHGAFGASASSMIMTGIPSLIG